MSGVVRHPGREHLGGLVVLAGFDMRPGCEPELPGGGLESLVARTTDREDRGLRLLRDGVTPDGGVADEDQGALGASTSSPPTEKVAWPEAT